MAREVNRLSARKVAGKLDAGRHADGGGLYLAVDDSGARRWVFLYRSAGKRREMGLGGANSVSLADAREKAAKARAAVANGIDPLSVKDTPKLAPLFSEVAERFMADHAPSWKSDIHRRQWRNSLKTHAPGIWSARVDSVDTAAVLDALRVIWHDNPETAKRVRSRIERVLDAARVAGHRTGENPARWRGHLQMMLPRPRALIRGHHAALPYNDAPAFIAALRMREALAARALELVILTVARSGQVRNMRWRDVDLASRIWSIPPEGMKAGRAHRVPLADRCVEILSGLTRGESEFVFLSGAGKPWSDMVFTALLKRMNRDEITTHGFRSTFKDWATDTTEHHRETIEAALAHVIGDKAERAYRRTDAIEKRRALLHDWAAFLGGTRGRDAK